jgi:heptosyltransferase III
MVLSRTDSIGDVVLTLPMAGYIKANFPQCRIIFLGRTYTRDVVALSRFVDQFLDYDDLKIKTKTEQYSILKGLGIDIFVHVFPHSAIARLAKGAGIPLRVGTTNRLFHWFSCNKLISLSRKNSQLHEAQLNLKLLSFLKIPVDVKVSEIASYYGVAGREIVPPQFAAALTTPKKKIVLHPKSKGSAREWGLNKFSELINRLPGDKYLVIIGGTQEDKNQLQEFLRDHPQCLDLTGKLTLKQYIAVINACDALVAASTGPLHIAAALGKKAIGLFSARRPIHPGRWRPLGTDAHYLVYDKHCPGCAAGKNCDCISRIDPQNVINLLENETI